MFREAVSVYVTITEMTGTFGEDAVDFGFVEKFIKNIFGSNLCCCGVMGV